MWLLTTIYIGLWPTRHYTPDAINNLFFIENQDIFELWHTQHLLAQWPGYWAYQVLHSFNGDIRPWLAMRIAHAVLAGATVALVFSAVFRLTGAYWIGILSGLALWFSYGFWHFHSDPDIYSLGYVATGLLMLCFVRYLQSQTTRNIILLGLAAAFAILTHQLALLFVGIIGVSLMYLIVKAKTGERWQTVRHVGAYASVILLAVFAMYVLGWLSVNAYQMQKGQPTLAFREWVVRYFAMSQAGQATWGVSSNLASLPTAGYTFVLSWMLPPPLDQADLLSLTLLGLIAAGAIVLAMHMVFVLRALPMPLRLVAVICASTLIANGIGGWWWQAGNVKFYLFMQIHLLILVALYAKQITRHTSTGSWGKRIGVGTLAVVGLGLALLHGTLTLLYETTGGVFAAAEMGGDKPLFVWFENQDQRRMFTYITPHKADYLSGKFCDSTAVRSAERTWWVVSEETAAHCPALAGMTRLGQYQADRSRRRWLIYDITTLHD